MSLTYKGHITVHVTPKVIDRWVALLSASLFNDQSKQLYESTIFRYWSPVYIIYFYFATFQRDKLYFLVLYIHLTAGVTQQIWILLEKTYDNHIKYDALLKMNRSPLQISSGSRTVSVSRLFKPFFYSVKQLVLHFGPQYVTIKGKIKEKSKMASHFYMVFSLFLTPLIILTCLDLYCHPL